MRNEDHATHATYDGPNLVHSCRYVRELEAELAAVRDLARLHQAVAEKAEAELAEWKKASDGLVKRAHAMKARAEKAEAEVERLKRHLWHGHTATVCDLPDCRKDEPGGGRESGEPGQVSAAGRQTTQPKAPPVSAAANPAARREAAGRKDGSRPREESP